MSDDQQYIKISNEYTFQLRGLLVPLEREDKVGASTRGAEELPLDMLAERSEKLADISVQLGGATISYLDAGDRAKREAAEMKLLAQATAEFEVARGLLELADEEGKGNTAEKATRSARAAGLQQSLDKLASVLETPIEGGMEPFLKKTVRRAGAKPTDPEDAKVELKEDAERSINQIIKQASKVGGRAVYDLLLLDGTALIKGADLIGKDVAQLMDKLILGLGTIARRLAASAIRLISQGYDWVLALIGKDMEQKARSQMNKWLDDIKKEHKEGKDDESIFANLVNAIYASESIKGDISNWLKATSVGVDKINRADEIVTGLSEKYKAKTNQVENLLRIIALAKLAPIAKMPQCLVIFAAITIGLLSYTIFTGYDHVDSGNVVFDGRFGFKIPDRVEGVRETVEKALEIKNQPINI